MKTVIMSIRAEHNRNIESGAKTLELRTMPPTCEVPFRVLTYESGPDGRHAVTNEWICDERTLLSPTAAILIAKAACVEPEYIREYTSLFEKRLFALSISELKVYDKPMELHRFFKRCDKLRCEGCEHLKFLAVNASERDWECEFLGSRIPITSAPQNYCYVTDALYDIK